MSVVFGYIGKDGVYLASDNRITDAEGILFQMMILKLK